VKNSSNLDLIPKLENENEKYKSGSMDKISRKPFKNVEHNSGYIYILIFVNLKVFERLPFQIVNSYTRQASKI
jgi:hypothetical protein